MHTFLQRIRTGSFERFPLYKIIANKPVPEIESTEDAYLHDQIIEENVGPLPAPTNEEKSDDYSKTVIQLNEKWRVIECKDGIHWILQIRKGKYKGKVAWRSRSFCRTKDGLSRCIREYSGRLTAETNRKLSALPERLS